MTDRYDQQGYFDAGIGPGMFNYRKGVEDGVLGNMTEQAPEVNEFGNTHIAQDVAMDGCAASLNLAAVPDRSLETQAKPRRNSYNSMALECPVNLSNNTAHSAQTFTQPNQYQHLNLAVTDHSGSTYVAEESVLQDQQHSNAQSWIGDGTPDQPSPANEQQPHQTSKLQPRIKDVLDVQISHLMQPSWRPISGTHDISTDDAETMLYVLQLFNSFLDTSEVFDMKERPLCFKRFEPDGEWTQDLADIEAVCHVIVNTATALHSAGAQGLNCRRFANEKFSEYTPESCLTFAQRIWVMARLIKHYKGHADNIMNLDMLEDYLVECWKILMEGTDFKEKWNVHSAQEKKSLMTEFYSLGLPRGRRSSTKSMNAFGASPELVQSHSMPKYTSMYTEPQGLGSLHLPSDALLEGIGEWANTIDVSQYGNYVNEGTGYGLDEPLLNQKYAD